MKKLFTLLSLTLLLALGWSAKANATDYYVVGNMTDWTYTPSAKIAPMSTTDNDTYTAELVVADGDNYFCIADGDGTSWDDFNDNHRYAINNQTVNVGETYTLAKNGEVSLKIAGVGIYLFTFVASTKELTVTKLEDVYTAAGSSTLLGSSWDLNDASNKLTTGDSNVYTLTKENLILSAGTYEFKVVLGHSWNKAYPNDNYSLNITKDGMYDVTITFTKSSGNVVAAATYKSPVALTFKYFIAGDKAIADGHDWDSSGTYNEMAVDGTTATLTLNNVVLATGDYGYKIIKQTYNAGVLLGTDWLGDPANSGDNFGLSVAKASTYNIAYSFDTSTGVATATPTEQFTGYYIVMQGDPWTVQGKMHLVPGTTTYTGGVQNWAGKCFAVAPNTALNDDFTGINDSDWDKVIRPKNAGSNYIVEFNYYDDQVETKAENPSNNYTWEVANTNDGMVDIAIYNNGTFSITCCTQAAIGEEGYATYSVAGPCEITGATAYIVVEEGGSYKLKEIPAGKAIPANTGVILKGSEGPYSVSSSTAAKADVSDNLLIGTGGSSYVITGNDGVKNYTPYIFANGNNGVGFYLISGFNGTQTIGAHKAFLALPKGAPARQFIGFDETGEATGISASLNEKREMTNEKVFNLSGQRVSQPTKGLYIVNGKKFVK